MPTALTSPPAAAALCAAIAIALLTRGRPGPRRLRRPTPTTPSTYRRLAARLKPTPVPPRTRRLHRLTAALLAAAALLLAPIPWSLAPALAIYLTTPTILSRLEPAATRKRNARLAADLPLAVDLLAACLRAGRPPQAAIATVSRAIDGPLATLLAELEHRLDLGADPIDAWDTLRQEPTCAPFARAVQRALRSGAPLATTLEAQSADLRQSRRWTAEEQARAVETRSVLPLGLCFLPAFVLLGIVPTIATTFTNVFADLAP
ncbi:type II secretion system F family protein [Kribbella italica]|uniref:Flp pilus assembly protein TadB n=1 Tax=Kribbella italica TaxID=1540520 RepID=A0A7W9JE98_9ACTN|nr:type II secretion system F family protein [Kribbella italica]MBB5839863.1 Flp pilus assembly protein TadB [Kribbella italica]